MVYEFLRRLLLAIYRTWPPAHSFSGSDIMPMPFWLEILSALQKVLHSFSRTEAFTILQGKWTNHVAMPTVRQIVSKAA
jgi:hypothetical protein